MSVQAVSGHWSDVQAAVNQAAAQGADTVLIPGQTYNFVDVDEPWRQVSVNMNNFPNGLRIFGAPTQRTSGLPESQYGMSPNNQVVQWQTILRMPYEVPQSGDPDQQFFWVTGNSDTARPFRLSDLKIDGYREIDMASTTMYLAADIRNVVNVRVDHCDLRNMCGDALFFRASGNQGTSGVVDHCRITNSYGIPHKYPDRTLGYGIGQKSYNRTLWEPADQILGKYTNYSLYVEDCYFEKWRHCISTGFGMHMGFRHNTIQYDYANHSIDNHGNYELPSRATEVYGNEILNCLDEWPGTEAAKHMAAQFNSGDMCVFDNHVDNSHRQFIWLWWRGDGDPATTKLYIWNNYLEPGVTTITGNGVEGTHYFLYERPNYTPYTYPHPLVSGVQLPILTVDSTPIKEVPFDITKIS